MGRNKEGIEPLTELINGIAKQVIPNPGIPLDSFEKPLKLGSREVAERLTDHMSPMLAGALILGGLLLVQQVKAQTALQSQEQLKATSEPLKQPPTPDGGEEVKDGKPKVSYTYHQNNSRVRGGR